ncbi:MbnP family copper-binding protein [Thalassolituus sp.]|uniref:MbnP family copper-binding protein n=1 Tax=Thalassolituus sp. TaxID=2030822 RepID=UPI003513BE81
MRTHVQEFSTAGRRFTIHLYAHDFKLVTDEGVEIDLTLNTLSGDSPAQNDRVVQLDLRDTVGCESGADANPNFNDLAMVSGTVPEGVTVSALRFTLGVPFDLNHASQSDAAEPLRNPGRASGAGWNWQNGYKFASFDVMPVGGWTDPADAERTGSRWNAHIGSTGCPVTASELESGTEPEACTNENRPVITLALGAFELEDLESESLESESVQVVIDYAELVDGVSVGQDEGGAPGCMSGPTDPECEVVFANLGLSWGDNAALTQSVFTLEAVPQSASSAE